MINKQVCVYWLNNELANSHIDLCNLALEMAASSLSWPLGRTNLTGWCAFLVPVAVVNII